MILSILFSSFRLESVIKQRLTIIISILLGGILSIYSSIIRSIPNYINRTRFAFWCMLPVVVALVFLGILSLFEKRLKVKNVSLYETLNAVFVGLYTTSTIFYYLPLLITGTSKFVNYGESPISTLVLFRLIGYVLGLFVVFLTSLTVAKTLSLLSKLELRIVVSLSLSIFGITQVAIIFLRLYSLKLISSMFFPSITFVINHSNLFIYIILLFVATMPILLWKKNIKVTEKYSNRAELRKLKATKRNARRWAEASLFFILISFLSLSILRYHVGKEVPLSPPENYVIENGLAIIPLEELEDDKLHRYQYISEDKISMRFIAIKKSEGAYGIGLDACDICGPSGYFERNGDVICKLCDVVMNKATIGFPGGCNPVPLPYILHDGKIKIKVEDLEKESYRFK